MPDKFKLDSITERSNAEYSVRWFTHNGKDPNHPTDPGNPNLMGDWSAAPKVFWVENSGSEIYSAERAVIFLSVSGSIDSGGFGNGPELTNGIKFYYYNARNGVYIDGLGTNFIYHNEDWAKHCYDTRVQTYGSGNQTFAARWTFANDGGPLTMEPNDKLVMILQDDLNSTRGIEDFTIKIGGKYLKGNATIASPQPVITYP